MSTQTLDALLSEAPEFHRDSAGNPTSWPVSETVLRFIVSHAGDGARTLETGAGFSTVAFALTGADHTCIVPSQGEVERIDAYCLRKGISTERIDYCVEPSERALPRLSLGELSLVLIDGSHSFPSPFIDWYYTASSLKVGGHVIVDDTQIWTGHVLKRFLHEERDWALRTDIPGKAAIFEKRAPVSGVRDWLEQPFVVRRSRPLELSRKASQAVRLLRRGQVRTVLAKIGARRP